MSGYRLGVERKRALLERTGPALGRTPERALDDDAGEG